MNHSNRPSSRRSAWLVCFAALLTPGCAGDDDTADRMSADEEAHAAGAKPDAKGRVSSSIAEGAELADPLRWTARVTGVSTGEVVSVRFLIDGKVAHVERQTPYEFGGRGNLLIPGTLGRGSHTLAVDARLRGGGRLTAGSTASVSEQAQGVPPEVLGHWTRTVTPGEVRRTDAFRKPEYGVPLPLGTWKLRIGADAVARYVDPTPAHDLTVGQVRFTRDGRLVVGNEVPNFPNARGYFCPDTVGTGEYRWSLDGRALLVRPVHDPECADRNSFWNGKFTTQSKEP
jgi:hypothetical protein